jgi:Domain of unknown function (DUF4411)
VTYLLDANTLIEAKNRYYQMSICPGYWDWLQRAHQAGEVSSIRSVREELKRGNDDLAEWAKQNAYLFLEESDPATQTAFAQVAQHVADTATQMKPGALDEFLSGADPWLIAKAMTTNATVVTHEQLNLAARRKFLIPNVCEHFNVPFVDTFELLNALEARFVLETPSHG